MRREKRWYVSFFLFFSSLSSYGNPWVARFYVVYIFSTFWFVSLSLLHSDIGAGSPVAVSVTTIALVAATVIGSAAAAEAQLRIGKPIFLHDPSCLRCRWYCLLLAIPLKVCFVLTQIGAYPRSVRLYILHRKHSLLSYLLSFFFCSYKPSSRRLRTCRGCGRNPFPPAACQVAPSRRGGIGSTDFLWQQTVWFCLERYSVQLSRFFPLSTMAATETERWEPSVSYGKRKSKQAGRQSRITSHTHFCASFFLALFRRS